MAKAAKKSGPKVLVANGVNLDLLGTREPGIYGTFTLADVEKTLREVAPQLGGCTLAFFQSNDEQAFIEKFDEGWDGALINPGAWTHTSLALADRLAALKLPYVEVHISNVAAREDFRKLSYTARNAVGVVHGFGMDSYVAGLLGLLRKLKA